MSRTSFRSRLLIVIASGFVVLLLIGMYAAFTFRESLTTMNQEQLRVAEQLRLVREIQTHFAQQNLAWANLLIRGDDPSQYHPLLSSFHENQRQTLERAEALLAQSGADTALNRRIGAFVASLHELRTAYREALHIYNGSKQSQLATDHFLSAITKTPATELTQIERLVGENHAQTLMALRQHADSNERVFAVAAVGTLGMLIIVLLWIVDRMFARPLALAINTADDIARGRLSQRIPASGSEEFDAFARAFNHMLDAIEHSNAQLQRNVARLRDEIAHREQIERALVSTNSELEAFSYSVSHDLRSPLRVIDGFASALHDDYGARLDGSGRDRLARIRRCAQHMSDLIDALIELSQVSQGQLNPVTLDLSAMAHEIRAELETADPARRVSFEIAPGVTARGDPQLLRVVLTNLLGNAWKYTRRSTEARIEFGAELTGPEPIFFVRDNGAGFDMQRAGQLFRAFERLHNSSQFEGTGIGLATVDRIIRRHGGRIWAEAEPGLGATFRFTLAPARSTAQERESAGDEQRVAGAGFR